MLANGMSSVTIRDEASLNVIIPMGGSGEAFRAAGYSAPKPMIKIAGRPMLLHLLDQLKLRLGDVVWLIIPSVDYAQFHAQLDFKAEFPQADIRICQFTVQTRGAAETLYIGLQQMSHAELSRRTLCLDCDILYFADVLSMFRAAPPGKGMCAYFLDQGTAALYSYLRLDDAGEVAEVHEKNAVSELANVGAYGFASATLLHDFIQPVLDATNGGRHQYYLSNVINSMIAQVSHAACGRAIRSAHHRSLPLSPLCRLPRMIRATASSPTAPRTAHSAAHPTSSSSLWLKSRRVKRSPYQSAASASPSTMCS